MGARPSCRSCRHCIPGAGVEMGWCQLRRLAIHPDLASELWCHHWMATTKRQPVLADGTLHMPASQTRQLALSELLN